MSRIEGKVALVTGANRGIGRAFVEELLENGSAKIYAAARKEETLAGLVKMGKGRVVPLTLDVTDAKMISKIASECRDVDILINNAGIAAFEGIISAKDDSSARQEMETNFFGTLNMVRAFAPVLGENGGGTIVNISSIAGHVNFPAIGSYSASKAAVHSLTQCIRAELAEQMTLVTGVYPGPVDTEMVASFSADKTPPNTVVKTILKGVEDGLEDIFPDGAAQEMHSNILSDPKAMEKEAGQMLPA